MNIFYRFLLINSTICSFAWAQDHDHQDHDHHDHSHGEPVDEATLKANLEKWEKCLKERNLNEKQLAVMGAVSKRLDPEVFLKLSKARQDLLIQYSEDLSTDRGVPRLCWAPDTPDEVFEAFHVAEEVANEINGMLPQDPQEARQISDTNRWSQTAVNGSNQNVQGRPVTLTWSIVPDGTTVPAFSIGNQEPSNLRARLADIFGGSATAPAEDQSWFSLFDDTFQNIAANSGLSYQYEPNDDGATISNSSFTNRGVLGVRGDIRICGRRVDGNGSVLAFNFFPSSGDMVLDTADNFFATTSTRGFGNVIEHEHGHGLGLPHVCPRNQTKLMEPFISTRFDGIQFDEIYSLNRLYGDFFEKHNESRNNDSVANATPLSVTLDQDFAGPVFLSIDDNSDTDFYLLPNLSENIGITFTVNPSDDIYLEGGQNRDGSCSAGTTFNSNEIHDLDIAIIGPDQSTVLRSASSNPRGEGESIVSFTTPSAGNYYLRVRGENVNRCQLYRMEVSLDQDSGPTIPNSPSNLVAITSGNNGIRLQWADNSNNETAFNVERRAEDEEDFTSLAITASNEDSFTDTTGIAGVNYFYQVNAINDTRVSPSSNQINAIAVDLSASSYSYDLGLLNSPKSAGTDLIFPDTRGDISWNGEVIGRDRGGSNGVDSLDRDFVFSSSARVLEHEITNGLWLVTVRSGDANFAHDNIAIRAEGEEVISQISTMAGSFVERYFLVNVNDGGLTLRFSDEGGSGPNWVLNGLSFERVENTDSDDDGDGLNILSELFFGTDPGENTSRSSIFSLVDLDGRLSYTRSTTSNIDFTYESSTNLIDWSPFTPTQGENISPLSNGQEQVEIVLPLQQNQTFIRLRLTAP